VVADLVQHGQEMRCRGRAGAGEITILAGAMARNWSSVIWSLRTTHKFRAQLAHHLHEV
jgi:hypothetical protein